MCGEPGGSGSGIYPLPVHRAQSPDEGVAARALPGPGPQPGFPGLVPAPRAPPGARAPLSAGLRPAARPAAPAAPAVVRPGRKSPVALAAARGPARAAASRRSHSAGTPPSAPAWSVRPGPAPRGRRGVLPGSRYGRPSPGVGLRRPLARKLGTPLRTSVTQRSGSSPSSVRGGTWVPLLPGRGEGEGIWPLCLVQGGSITQDLSSRVCTDG